MSTPRVALTIAGSDSGGGAGIQTDLVTFAAHGVHGCSAITALTAQNTVGVDGVHVPPVEFLLAQLDAVLGDLPVAAVKTGMLATEGVVRAVADVAATGGLPQVTIASFLWTALGAVSQMAATVLMLAAMRERSFVVTTAYTKTEPVQVAVFATVFLGEYITPVLASAIIVATAGVIVLSWPSRAGREITKTGSPAG